MDDVRGRFLGLPHGTTPAAYVTKRFKCTIKFHFAQDMKVEKNIQQR